MTAHDKLSSRISEDDITYWYTKIVSQRAIHRQLGVSSNDVRNWRKVLKDPERQASMGHMLYVLNLAGCLQLGLPDVGEILD